MSPNIAARPANCRCFSLPVLSDSVLSGYRIWAEEDGKGCRIMRSPCIFFLSGHPPWVVVWAFHARGGRLKEHLSRVIFRLCLERTEVSAGSVYANGSVLAVNERHILKSLCEDALQRSRRAAGGDTCRTAGENMEEGREVRHGDYRMSSRRTVSCSL